MSSEFLSFAKQFLYCSGITRELPFTKNVTVYIMITEKTSEKQFMLFSESRWALNCTHALSYKKCPRFLRLMKYGI